MLIHKGMLFFFFGGGYHHEAAATLESHKASPSGGGVKPMNDGIYGICLPTMMRILWGINTINQYGRREVSSLMRCHICLFPNAETNMFS